MARRGQEEEPKPSIHDEPVQVNRWGRPVRSAGQSSRTDQTAGAVQKKPRTPVSKSKIALWSSVGLFALMCAGTGLSYASASNDLHAAQSEEQKQQHVLDQAQAEAKQRGDLLAAVSTNMDANRKAADDAKMQSIMSTAGTWDSDAKYDQARNQLMEAMNIDKNSSFMTVFMPEDSCSTDTKGEKYCSIDEEGLNSEFNTFTSQVISNNGGQYKYFGLAEMTVHGSNGGTSTRYSTVEYTTNVRGDISDIHAYASTTAPDHSG